MKHLLSIVLVLYSLNANATLRGEWLIIYDSTFFYWSTGNSIILHDDVVIFNDENKDTVFEFRHREYDINYFLEYLDEDPLFNEFNQIRKRRYVY